MSLVADKSTQAALTRGRSRVEADLALSGSHVEEDLARGNAAAPDNILHFEMEDLAFSGDVAPGSMIVTSEDFVLVSSSSYRPKLPLLETLAAIAWGLRRLMRA